MDIKFGIGLCRLIHLTRYQSLKNNYLSKFYMINPVTTNNCVFFSSTINDFLNNLVLQEGSKREVSISKYINLIQSNSSCLMNPSFQNVIESNEILNHTAVESLSSVTSGELMDHLLANMLIENQQTSDKLHYILIFLSKSGNVNGVKTVQLFIQKHHGSEYKLRSGFKHYLAQALWVKGNIKESIFLFSEAYDNVIIQNYVKCMMTSLFPLLIAKYSEATLKNSVILIQKFSNDKQDRIFMSCLWKELFLSSWFSDNQIAHQIIEENVNLIKLIQWMIPLMGKALLKNHRVDDFHRLLEFSLRNNLKHFSTLLIRLLFDYHYIHQNIERCSAVVKYSVETDYPLTESQQKNYVALLLKCKSSSSSKKIVKKPQDIKYNF